METRRIRPIVWLIVIGTALLVLFRITDLCAPPASLEYARAVARRIQTQQAAGRKLSETLAGAVATTGAAEAAARVRVGAAGF
jgi:hypothetical protein